jgi:hypothetical protein
MTATAATPITAYSGPTVSRANPAIKRLLDATFPEYRGRKIQLRAWTRPMRLENYWDGGTRSYWAMIDTTTNRIGTPTNDNPFRADAHAEVDLPAGWIAVEHCIFQGHDLGIRIYARADAAPAMAAGLLALGAGR